MDDETWELCLEFKINIEAELKELKEVLTIVNDKYEAKRVKKEIADFEKLLKKLKDEIAKI